MQLDLMHIVCDVQNKTLQPYQLHVIYTCISPSFMAGIIYKWYRNYIVLQHNIAPNVSSVHTQHW